MKIDNISDVLEKGIDSWEREARQHSGQDSYGRHINELIETKNLTDDQLIRVSCVAFEMAISRMMDVADEYMVSLTFRIEGDGLLHYPPDVSRLAYVLHRTPPELLFTNRNGVKGPQKSEYYVRPLPPDYFDFGKYRDNIFVYLEARRNHAEEIEGEGFGRWITAKHYPSDLIVS